MRWSAFCALFPVLAVGFWVACPVSARAAGFDEDPPSELASVLVRKAKRAERAGVGLGGRGLIRRGGIAGRDLVCHFIVFLFSGLTEDTEAVRFM